MFRAEKQSPIAPGFDWGPPPDGSHLPVRIVIVGTVVVFIISIFFYDESSQYDPAKEKAALESRLVSIAKSIQDTKERRAKLVSLLEKSKTDPGIITREKLPPLYQRPFSYDTVEEYQKTAQRRIKRADEELEEYEELTQLTHHMIENLPPASEKRVSLFRRFLSLLYKDAPPQED